MRSLLANWITYRQSLKVNCVVVGEEAVNFSKLLSHPPSNWNGLPKWINIPIWGQIVGLDSFKLAREFWKVSIHFIVQPLNSTSYWLLCCVLFSLSSLNRASLFYWIYLPDTFQQVHRIWSISPPIISIIVSVLRLVKNQTIRRETQIFHPSHRHRLSPKLNWPFDWEFRKVFSI